MTQTEFGSEIGASRAMIASYESGKVVPDKTTRLLLCEKFNVNQTWLETGDGEPYREDLTNLVVNALSYMPALRSILESNLSRMSYESLRNIDNSISSFLNAFK